jgi:RNA recognition motif-containing protein
MDCGLFPISEFLPEFLCSQYNWKRKDWKMPKLFVGNIPHASSDVELQQWVESHGFRVQSAQVIYDRVTGKSRGFGFVTLADEENLQSAIGVLNKRRMNGRVLTVNEATPLTADHFGDAKAGQPVNRTF